MTTEGQKAKVQAVQRIQPNIFNPLSVNSVENSRSERKQLPSLWKAMQKMWQAEPFCYHIQNIGYTVKKKTL